MAVRLDENFFNRCVRQQVETLFQEGPYHPELLLGDYSDVMFCEGVGRKGMLEPFLARVIDRALRKRPDMPVLRSTPAAAWVSAGCGWQDTSGRKSRIDGSS